jgi:hypothetical protein
LKHKNTQPSYIFNRENPQNSEPRRGLDFIALLLCTPCNNNNINGLSKEGSGEGGSDAIPLN